MDGDLIRSSSYQGSSRPSSPAGAENLPLVAVAGPKGGTAYGAAGGAAVTHIVHPQSVHMTSRTSGATHDVHLQQHDKLHGGGNAVVELRLAITGAITDAMCEKDDNDFWRCVARGRRRMPCRTLGRGMPPPATQPLDHAHPRPRNFATHSRTHHTRNQRTRRVPG